MAFTIVQSAFGNTNGQQLSTSATFGSAPTAGNTILVELYSYCVQAGQTIAISDNKGNTYAAAGATTGTIDGGFIVFKWFSCVPPTVGSNFTITVTCNLNSFINLVVYEVNTGGVTLTAGTPASKIGNGGSVTSTGNIAISGNSLVLAMATDNTVTAPWTPGSGYTATENIGLVQNISFGVIAEYLNNTSTNPAAPTATAGGTLNAWAMAGIAFAASSSGGNVQPIVKPAVYTSKNWFVNASSYIECTYMGGYFKTTFTGTSATLGIMLTSGNSTKVGWFIDGGPTQFATLTSSNSSLSLATGLAAGSHTLYFYLSACESGVRWTNNPGVRVTSITLDHGATLSAPAVLPNLLYVFGDSIAEGQDLAGGWDWYRTFILGVAEQLNAEVATFAIAGLAYTVGVPDNNTDVPPFYTPGNSSLSGWNQYYSGLSLLTSGRFTIQPNWIINELSRNDAWYQSIGFVTTAQIEASMSGWLAACRAAAPNAWIFPTVPFCQEQVSTFQTAFNSYQSATPDSKCVLLNLGASYAPGLNAQFPGGVPFEVANVNSVDGVHPNSMTHGRIAAAITALINTAIG
jgi:hypothetical protein